MDDHWRTMAAEAAAGPNIINGTTATAAFQAIDAAHRIFDMAAQVCGRFRQGLQYQPGAGEAPPDNLPAAISHVRRAFIYTRSVSVSHGGAGHAFSLSTARIGLQDSAPAFWQSCKGRHAAAAAHAATALQSVRSALSHGLAATGAVSIMLATAPMLARGGHAANQLLNPTHVQHLFRQQPAPPQGLLLWDAWGHAAEQLLRRAADDLAMARAALQQMRPHALAELSDAFNLLSR